MELLFNSFGEFWWSPPYSHSDTPNQLPEELLCLKGRAKTGSGRRPAGSFPDSPALVVGRRCTAKAVGSCARQGLHRRRRDTDWTQIRLRANTKSTTCFTYVTRPTTLFPPCDATYFPTCDSTLPPPLAHQLRARLKCDAADWRRAWIGEIPRGTMSPRHWSAHKSGYPHLKTVSCL